MIKKILFLIVVIAITISCNKYENGPVISFRTKTGRLSNEWVVDSSFLNGKVKTDSLPKFEIIFEKGGEVTRKAYINSPNGLDSITKTGIWEFDSDAENVLILYADNFGINESHIWRILKLTNDEFWFEEVDSLNLVKYYLKEKP